VRGSGSAGQQAALDAELEPVHGRLRGRGTAPPAPCWLCSLSLARSKQHHSTRKRVSLGQQLAGTGCPAAGNPTDRFARVTPKTPCSPFGLCTVGDGKSSGPKSYSKPQSCTPMTQGSTAGQRARDEADERHRRY